MTDSSSEPQTAKRKVPRPLFGAPHVFVLVLVDGDRSGEVHRIAQRETILGRGDEADLSLDDSLVSKRHCAIRADGPVCSVVDLGSLNGSALNDRPLRQGVSRRLRHLDELRVGDTRMLFLAGRIRQAPSDV